MGLVRVEKPVKLILAFVVAVFPFFLLLRAAPTPLAASSDVGPVYVGLIEDDRRELTLLANYGRPVPGQKSLDDPVPGRNITPYFVKDGSEWKRIQQLNQKMRWTVAFDGRSLGQIDSEPIPLSESRPKGFPALLCVHAILTPSANIPVVGRASGDFDGGFGVYVRRPLVVVSRPNFVDPDQWKRTKPPDDVVEQTRATFRETFRHVRRCDPSGEILKTDARFPDSDILVLKAYGSNKDSFLIETQLKNHRCVYNVDGGKLQLLEGVQWYYVTPNREAVFLARDWQLVDAGDYDSDGKSEVIFYVAESEEDSEIETAGYVLFYDDFRRSVRFTWTFK